MIRQRVALRTPLLAYFVRALTFLLALTLIWYGLMVVLLSVKVSPDTVNALSGYRTIYHDAATLTAADFTTTVRLIAGFAGLVAFLLFLYLALQELPRPFLARGEITLEAQTHGTTTLKPRAIERLAELAALGTPDVSTASGRLGDEELNLSLSTHRAGTTARTLRDVQRRVLADLHRHDLPRLPVNVTITGYDHTTHRELS